MAPITLPPNLTQLTLTRFDSLVASDKLHYGQCTSEKVTHNGFMFEFSIPPACASKPVLAPSDPSRHKPGGPFLNPDPDFVLCEVGPDYLLELNLHCILRPQYILHTKEYKKQSDDLSKPDLEATWAVIKALNAEEGTGDTGEGEGIMAIYNCGAEAGASQGHKHLQLFPKPKRSEFDLFPYQMELSTEVIKTHSTVPFKHALMAIPANAIAEELSAVYEKLMGEMKPLMKKEGIEDYNVVIVQEWMLVIPRRHHGRDGVECNSVGMMGMIWVKDEEERQGWERLGMTEHLKWLGLPA